VIRFDRARAQDLQAVFALRVRLAPRRRPVVFELRVEHGHWRVRPGAPAAADATATIGARDLGRLAVGSTGWPELLSSGRLELAGDPFLALRLPMLFRLPVGSRARGTGGEHVAGQRRLGLDRRRAGGQRRERADGHAEEARLRGQ
jgi:hypothetical protein